MNEKATSIGAVAETRGAVDFIENRTFDDIEPGDSASLVRTLTFKDIELFAVMSGDVNPAHVDEEFAKSDVFHKVIAHGMWGGALISTVLGTELPGPGTIYLDQSLRFRRPIGLGDTITVTVTVTEKIAEKRRVLLDCQAVNQAGEVVISGSATVLAPTEKIRRPRIALQVREVYERGKRLRELIERTRSMPPVRTAIVHPVDAVSLAGAVEAAKWNLIAPVLVGPEAKIREAAEAASINLAGYEIVPADHAHSAAKLAIAMARDGRVGALMNGNLRIAELMKAVIDPRGGLRTGRRMSHVVVVDVPYYPRLHFITDDSINIAPTLADKRDIVQNAIELVQALGVATPKVAILAAIETVSPSIAASVDAAALCKMADRGQIVGGLVDGPLAFDNAVSLEAAQTKGIVSQVAGAADILVAPDLEAGNMLAMQLEYLADAEVAGIVLGARVPIILAGRADRPLARLASCALAQILVGPDYVRLRNAAEDLSAFHERSAP